MKFNFKFQLPFLGSCNPRPEYGASFYEGRFRNNITVPVTSLCMIQFSKTIPHFVRVYIIYKMVKSETKNAC